jgi:hypothetical protein
MRNKLTGEVSREGHLGNPGLSIFTVDQRGKRNKGDSLPETFIVAVSSNK